METLPSLVDPVVEDGKQNAENDERKEANGNSCSRGRIGGHGGARDDEAYESDNNENNENGENDESFFDPADRCVEIVAAFGFHGL